VILGVLACCGSTLLLTGATAAATSSAPTKAQQAFVKAVHSEYPQNPAIPASTMPAATLISLGGATCGLLINGKSVKYVVNQLSKVSDGKHLPGEFVTAVLVESSTYLCPKYAPAVKKWAGVGSASTKQLTSLRLLLPPESTSCTTVEPSEDPPGMVGVVDAITCDLPKLGSNSFVYGYLFDNASDYTASLNAYNTFKSIVPPTPGVGCPTSKNSDNGVESWSNKDFPARKGQILECTMVTTVGGTTNNVPDYIWTVPTKDVIIGATGNPGSSMQHLDTWWTADSDT
jgi:hypothetical protein